jgi:hypothetical protein
MTAPIYVVALIVSIPVCWYADRIPQYRGLVNAGVIGFGFVFCAIGTGVLAYTPRYVFLCFINTSIWAGSPIAISFATSSMANINPEVRAISLGLLISLAQLAPVYASNLYPASDAPSYLTGFATYTALFGFAALLSGAGHFLLKKFPYKAE